MKFLTKLFILSTLLYTLFSCGVDNFSHNKKVFKYNQVDALGALDPAFSSDESTSRAVTQIYNGLVELDEDMKVVPSLAKRWVLSENQKTYTFYLNQGIHFHDHPVFTNGKGRELTAYDVEYSFRRICDTNDIYNKGIWIFKDKVLKKPDGTLSDTCFNALNDTTFQIHLQDPNPLILQIVSMPYAFVLAPEIVKHYGVKYRRNPVGTGPFKFFMWEEGNSLVLHKNDNYWKKDSEGNKLPYLDAIQLYFITERAQAFRAFEVGKIDFFDDLAEDQIEDVILPNGNTKSGLDYEVMRDPYLFLEYIGFQLDKNAECYKGNPNHPLLNVDFRRALNYGVDRKKLINVLRNGVGTPGVYGIVPPSVPGFGSDFTEGYVYDVTKAKFYLKQSGVKFEDLPTLTLAAGKVHKSLVEFLVKSWEESLGIKVDIALNEPKVNRDLASKGQLEMFRSGWIGDYPDAENYLSLFYSLNKPPYGSNRTRYTNTELDKLFESSKLSDDSTRLVLYHQMDSLITSEAPVVPLFYKESLSLVQNRVKGLKFNAMKTLKLEKVNIVE